MRTGLRFTIQRTAVACTAVLLVFAGGIGAAHAAPSTSPVAHPVPPKPHREHHYVYVQSDDASANEVIGYDFDGSSLTKIGSWATGGQGTGFWLGSQGSVARQGKYLYAVDGGSNDVALFEIGKRGALRLLDREAIYGVKPVSVTVEGDKVVVLSVKTNVPCGGLLKCAPVQDPKGCAPLLRCGLIDQDHLTLLRRHHDSLEALDHIDLAGTGGAQVSFVGHPHAKRLIVTEKKSNTIVSVTLRKNRFGTPTSIASSGDTPYGFGIARHETLVVTNAENETDGAGTVSSYSLRKKSVNVVTSRLGNGQKAPCWLAVGKGGRTAYVSNPDSNTISLYGIGKNGSLTLKAASATSPVTGPIDLEVHDVFLFVTAWQQLHVLRIGADGTATSVAQASIPDYAQGIVVK